MKLRHYTIIATLALLAASCAHEESEEAQISDIQLAITAAFATPAADFAAAGVGVGDASAANSSIKGLSGESAAEQADLLINSSTRATATASNSTENPAKSATKSTTTAFESGDLLGLYAVKSGGELNAASNLINNHQLKVAESGAIVGDLLPAYYPDKSSSLDLFSYYPYQSGNATADALGVLVGIRTHQTDFSHVQASDLCYGQKLDAAPSAAPHPLQFRHSFAQLRLNFSLYEGCSAISAVKLLAIKDSAKLNLQTGLVTLLPHTADVDPYVGSLSNSADATNPLQFTAIIPAQSLSGACVEITLTDGTIYYYHAVSPIALKESATNTLNLRIADKKVITTSGTPAITAWGVESTISNISESTDNAFTFYWSPAITSFGSIDKAFVTLTNPATKKSARIEVAAFVRDATSTAANAIFRFSITRTDAASIGYPVTIDKFELFNGGTAVHTLTDYYGRTVTRSGAHTFGTVTSIKLSETTWNNVSGYGDSKTITVTTTGNVDWTASSNNANLTIAPTSGISGQTATLTWAPYFNASALGNRTATVTFATNPAGATATLTTAQNGVVPPSNAIYINGIWWATGNLIANGANGCKVGAPTDGGLYFQFGSLVGWTGGASGNGVGVPAAGSPTVPALGISVKPVGCQVPATWNTAWSGDPKSQSAVNGTGDPCAYYLGGTWRLPTPLDFQQVANYSPWATNGSTVGRWFGPISNWSATNAVWLPAAGLRGMSSGQLSLKGFAYALTSELHVSGTNYTLATDNVQIVPQAINNSRAAGLAVRCVQDAPTKVNPPTADQVVTINGLKWTKGNLIAAGGKGCKVGAPGDGGLYFQFGGLIGYRGGAYGDGSGMPTAAMDNKVWGGKATFSSDDVAVIPTGYTKPTDAYLNFQGLASGGYGYYYYSNVISGSFKDQPNGKNDALGIGDPCEKYLGGTWRLPTKSDIISLIPSGSGVPPATANAVWQASPAGMIFDNSGAKLFIPASGYRSELNGVFLYATVGGYISSMSVFNGTFCSGLGFYSDIIYNGHNFFRHGGFAVRCVSN